VTVDPGAMLCRHLNTWTDHEPNPVVDVQPVKLALPIVLACVGDDSDRSTEDTLQLVGRSLPRTDQETATVVEPASDERMAESSGPLLSASGRVVVERASDAA